MKEEDTEQYLKRGPVAVLGVLQRLLKNQTPILLSHSRGQFITKLLAANQTGLVLDAGSNDDENQRVSDACDLQLTADIQGNKVEFVLSTLKQKSFEELPAFSAALPDVLWMIQRREFFRVSAPLNPVFYCYVKWPDGSGEGRLRLSDLSLGGIGVLADSPVPKELCGGEQFKKLRVELGEYGRFEVDAELISVGKCSIVVNKNETITRPRLSFRFNSLNAAEERSLQQVIFSLERLARDKANRFQ